jgi:hypothetical protein
MATTPEELVPDDTGASGRSVKTLNTSRALNEIGAYEAPFPGDSFPNSRRTYIPIGSAQIALDECCGPLLAVEIILH